MEQKQKQQVALLDAIQEFIGCEYLSDLHSPYLRKDISLALRRLRDLGYDLKEWNAAAAYIGGKPCCFSSVEEAYVYLTQK